MRADNGDVSRQRFELGDTLSAGLAVRSLLHQRHGCHMQLLTVRCTSSTSRSVALALWVPVDVGAVGWT